MAAKKRSAAKKASGPAASAPRRSRGAPTTITPAIQREICDYMAAGNFLDTACYVTGQSVNTVKGWMKMGNREVRRRLRGLKPNSKHDAFHDFALAVKKASAESEIRN